MTVALMDGEDNKIDNETDEKYLMDRIQLCKTNLAIDTKLDELKRLRPEIGVIEGVQHTKSLKKSAVIYRRPYSMPKTRKSSQGENCMIIVTWHNQRKQQRLCLACISGAKKEWINAFFCGLSQLKRNTILDLYPFPNMHDYLNDLHRASVFSRIDLNIGY